MGGCDAEGGDSMGHSVVRCNYCGKDIMEGRNDWKCDCGAVCNALTGFALLTKAAYAKLLEDKSTR